jgi:tetratricopeptide (TPR) repeat protein
VRAEPRQIALCFCLILVLASITVNSAAQQRDQSEVESVSRLAQEALAAKDWTAAVKFLERFAELAPNLSEVQGDLGLAYYSENRILEASKAFERALRLNPKMTQAATMLGLCYAELGRNQQAVPILVSAFRRPPDGRIGRMIGLDLQRAYAGLQQYDKAMVVAEELLKRYPNDPEILFHASRLHADRAYELMSHLMQRAPGSVWVHYATAEVHESLQRYDLAIKEYRNVLEMEPRLPGIHFRLGRAILQSSKEINAIDAALHEFELELAIAPQYSDAEYEIGVIYRRRGQIEPALEHFSRAVQHHPDFAQARIGLASILISQGRQREALGHLLEAVRAEPQNEVPHFRLAAVYKSLGDTANHHKEMALYQKLHSAAERTMLPLSGASAREVTQQTISESPTTN